MTPAVILDTSGPEIRVCNTAKACLRKENYAASPEGVTFEAGSDVMLCRGGDVAMSPTEVPVDCSKTFTELAIEVGAILYISSYLSAGACRCFLSCLLNTGLRAWLENPLNKSAHPRQSKLSVDTGLL